MRNLLKMPVGDMLLGAERWYAPCDGGQSSAKVPHFLVVFLCEFKK